MLEKQALTELDIFSKENSKLKNSTENEDLEEGEIVDTAPENNKKTADVTLDLDSYIKTQEALKKVQDFKKSLVKENEKKLSDKKAAKIKKHKKRKIVQEKDSNLLSNEDIAVVDNLEENSQVDVADGEDEKTVESGSEYVPSEDELGNK